MSKSKDLIKSSFHLIFCFYVYRLERMWTWTVSDYVFVFYDSSQDKL